jgi:hypothetical protein
MTQHSVVIAFPDTSPDLANGYAESLAKEIRETVRDHGRAVDPQVTRTDGTAQDFGTTIVLVLGAPAVIVLANAVRDWARRTDRGDITMNGVTIRNVASKDVKDIVRAIESRKQVATSAAR